MSKRRKVDSREIGLEIGLILTRQFLKTDHLHYGLWPDSMKIDLFNLPRAQENYSDFLISHIPDGAETVLDVGCGVGRFARTLTDRGYAVDCVSPSPRFASHARELLDGKSRVYECRFEMIQTDRRYDIILFSESFQYVHLGKALQNSHGLLSSGGHLLICDFFKTDAEGESALGGGHRLSRFHKIISGHPFRQVEDIDITDQTAPNLALVDDLLKNVGLPTWDLALYFFNHRYPLFSKLLQWRYRKKIETIHRKYFRGARNAETFAAFKTYRLLLYKKIE